MTERSTSERSTTDDTAVQPAYDENTDHVDHRRTDHDSRGAHDAHDRGHATAAVHDDAEARDRFGGTNAGAAFFGWLVAVAMAILLSGVVGAVAAAVGSSVSLTQNEAENEAGTIGIVAAVILAAVLFIAYNTGGSVAGRMSRFDGARQGLAVWLVGLLVTALAVGIGLLFGREYNILDRVSLPNIPIPTDQLSTGGIITAVVIVLGTLLAAMAGGKVGHRYHDKVDRAAFH
jgi:hypothetical protein